MEKSNRILDSELIKNKLKERISIASDKDLLKLYYLLDINFSDKNGKASEIINQKSIEKVILLKNKLLSLRANLLESKELLDTLIDNFLEETIELEKEIIPKEILEKITITGDFKSKILTKNYELIRTIKYIDLKDGDFLNLESFNNKVGSKDAFNFDFDNLIFYLKLIEELIGIKYDINLYISGKLVNE